MACPEAFFLPDPFHHNLSTFMACLKAFFLPGPVHHNLPESLHSWPALRISAFMACPEAFFLPDPFHHNLSTFMACLKAFFLPGPVHHNLPESLHSWPALRHSSSLVQSTIICQNGLLWRHSSLFLGKSIQGHEFPIMARAGLYKDVGGA
ncbi:uncharacterized protein CIMG_13172 [Coccidioides immitis RS]|uniref:Uncharacterized protein n=1 Tax=Coccidioides immitis (strain RS) TaxID=246410 RepID=A0A0D8JTX0_COCIM|nr:uncharacterized protein CIMG_13172 [Coccidioides immitis RS]KJF60727.1 hypothetical protein CIMG_13172 [Coccidioides immitis RS]